MTVSMATFVYAGLIDTGAADGSANTVAFDNVSLASGGFGFLLSASSAAVLTTPSGAASITVSAVGTPEFSHSIGFSVAGLPAGVSATFSPTSVTGSGAVRLSLSIGSGVTTGTYLLTITGADSITGATQQANVSLVVLPANLLTSGALPAGWSNQDIGQPSPAGQTFYSGAVFELQGSGEGIDESDTSDQFQYAFTGLQGNGSIVARFLTAQDPDSDAGIMIRNSLDANPYSS